MTVPNLYESAVAFLRTVLAIPKEAGDEWLADELRSRNWDGDSDRSVIDTVLASAAFKKMLSEHHQFLKSREFLETYEWRALRMKAIMHHGARCQCCGVTPDHGAVINVDHIRPRRTHPWLALVFENLQILCHTCNHGKGNWDSTDWRPGCFADAYICH